MSKIAFLSQVTFNNDNKAAVKPAESAAEDPSPNPIGTCEFILIECIRFGEENLEKLGVVGDKARFLIRAIEKLGGAAKITGAGGFQEGSGMLVVYHKDIEQILTYAKQKKLEAMNIKIGEEGVSRET